VVWHFDRLQFSFKHPFETLTDLAKRGTGFKSLTEQIDTTTPGGKLVFHVLDALVEFKRETLGSTIGQALVYLNWLLARRTLSRCSSRDGSS
jgi:DNA invertase Pin-like site-specific DNA recombinase